MFETSDYLEPTLGIVPQLLKRGQKFIENATFVDIEINRKHPFVAQYKKVFNEYPSIFAAHGYDLAFILRPILEKGLSTRAEFKQELEKTESFSGVFGETTLKNRQFLWPLQVFTVKNGRIQKAASK